MINQVTLVGRLTKEPTLKYTGNGIATATFTLAVNRTFKSGEQEADFINIVVWRKTAENAANYLTKGSLAGITGRIQTRNYEGSDGKRVFIVEVVADSVQFLEPKKDTQQNNSYSSNQQQQENNNQSYDDPFSNNSGTIEINTDDLPF